MKRLKGLPSFLWRHKILSSIGIVVLLILVLILRPKPPIKVATQTVEPTDITQIVSVSGTVVAKNTANLTFPVSGTVSWVGVKVGDNVTVGQTIATLDQRTALKNLQQSLLNYSLARDKFDQTAADNGGNGVPNEQAALSIAPNDTVKRVLEDNQYNLDEAVNSVELQNLASQQSILSTPIAGVVTRADATTPGVTALPSTVFTVVDPNSVVFSMDVDEADVGKIQQGQQASLTLDAYPNETLTLPVDFIDFVSHTTANGGNAYAVEVKLDNTTNYKYRVGMNGNADITTAERKHVLTIPLSSIVNDNQVYVKKGKKFVLKKVTLGLQSDTESEVTSGLTAGDEVAMDPTQIPNSQK